jgi:hypothetical protein
MRGVSHTGVYIQLTGVDGNCEGIAILHVVHWCHGVRQSDSSMPNDTLVKIAFMCGFCTLHKLIATDNFWQRRRNSMMGSLRYVITLKNCDQTPSPWCVQTLSKYDVKHKTFWWSS